MLIVMVYTDRGSNVGTKDDLAITAIAAGRGKRVEL